MSAPSLTDFLLARLAEDEQRAREDGADAMVGWRWKHYPEEAYKAIQSLTLETSRRVLADVEAKRAIVELHPGPEQRDDGLWRAHDPCNGYDPWPCPTLRALAAPYADHPDYDPTWRP